MKSRVYFSSMANEKFDTPLKKVNKLLHKCGITEKIDKGDIVAVKIHFGEMGNTSFIRPIYARPVIEELNKLGAKPYLTDTNTLYVGMRTNSVDHIHNANLNGFNYATLQVPVIIADGMRGENSVDIRVDLELSKKVKLASDMVNADGMVVMSHFKGHEISAFGGAIKNISMGCASRQGKLDMHSKSKPVVKQSICNACGLCVKNCQVQAIEIKEKAYITAKCVGCARCIAICPVEAINILWNESSENTQKKMAEYAYGLIKCMNKKIVFINFLLSMSPACDCYKGNDMPVCRDLGILASDDPVALDKASYDLVLKEAGKDPFKEAYPEIDGMIQLKHAEKIGIGSTDYEIVDLK